MANQKINRQIEVGLQEVETQLDKIMDSDVELLYDASHHIMASGGKRVRPQVLFLAALASGVEDLTPAYSLAAAVEAVHTATLVHDDINDHSLTRRGQVSVHARWGRTFALLTGDYMFAKVYETMAPYGSPFNEIMSTACVRLVEGETIQAAAAKAGEMDRETYKQIISRKTASLFEAAAEMGARLGQVDDDVVEALAEYGYNLGLTFQIVDDILDIIGDPETLGKPVGADLAQSRGVMMAQNGPVTSPIQSQTAVLDEDPVAKLMSSLRESGAVEVARLQAVETANRARTVLDRVPESPARQALLALVDTVLDRDQ